MTDTDTLADRQSRINALRRGIKFASPARRTEIAARIAALELTDAGHREASGNGTPARDVPTGESWAFREHRSLAEIVAGPAPPRCALEGCDRLVRPGLQTRYCSVEHAHKANRRSKRVAQAAARERSRTDADKRPYREKHPLGELGPKLPPRPPYRLTIDPSFRIRPPIPAPVRRYTNGVPTPFQDDLNAVRDHGSPGPLMAPEVGQVWRSVLA